MPKVSVITVVRNGEKFIRATMESVLSQDVLPDEYIIWDGLSTDRTLEIVSEFSSPIVKVTSKKDSGPFDAMNLAVMQCTGQWVLFMNCGDEFATPTVLKDVKPFLEGSQDLVYGGCIKVFPFGERQQLPGFVRDLWKSTIFWHQSLFVRKDLQQRLPFDCRYGVCADYDFTWKAYCQGAKFLRIEKILSRVSTGGISDLQELNGIVERYKITKGDIPFKSFLILVLQVSKYAVRLALKRLLPDAIVRRIQLSRKVSA